MLQVEILTVVDKPTSAYAPYPLPSIQHSEDEQCVNEVFPHASKE